MNKVEKPRVLIVDDEASIRKVLTANLDREFSLEEARDGAEAIEKIRSFHPNLIILDLGLPGLNGSEILTRLREWSDVPVIILTATDDESTKVNLLEAGADDFLTKPFSLPEMLARMRVALRHRQVEATPIFTSAGLSIDLNLKTLSVDGTSVKLSATEFSILQRLIRQNGGIVSTHQLMLDIWGEALSDQVHYVRVYVAQIRKKIEKQPSDPAHLITVPGVGYRLV